MKKDIEMTESAPSADEVSPQAPTFEDAGQAISQGKRHLLVRDYGLAVATLAEGVGMLANQHGEMADELAEPYLLYGKALLFLAREEAGVLGAGVPGAEDEEDEEDEAEEEPVEKEKEDGDKEAEKKADKEAEKEADKEAEKEADKKEVESKAEEKKETPVEDKKESAAETEEKKPEESTAGGSGSASAEPGGSTSSKMNGEASTSGLQQNGAHDNSEDDGEDVDEEDDANSNLRIAWEVLELAKLIFTKRGESGWKLLADVHRLLGEVSMEGGNQPAALIDLNACLDLLQKIDPVDPRSMAEAHYQLGLAHSLGNEFDDSIEQFLKATSLLEARIEDLQSSSDETAADEIKELKELLPEIQDKVADMRDFKSQAAKMVIEKIKSMSGGSCSNGAGPSSEVGSSSSSAATTTSSKEAKPASDISHLVRKKRKQEDGEEDEPAGSPCKKILSEKSA